MQTSFSKAGFSRQLERPKLPLEVQVWRNFIRMSLRIYPHGLYELGRNSLFGTLRLRPEQLEMIKDETGRLKEPWLTRVAFFLARAKKEEPFTYVSELDLIIIGIYDVLAEDQERKIRVPVAPNVILKVRRN